VADFGQQGAHREAIDVRFIVEEADVEGIFSVKMFDYADIAIVQLRHHRQAPAVNRRLFVAQELKA